MIMFKYESLFQGFRMVGSITKNGERTRAFKVGEKSHGRIPESICSRRV